MSKVTPTSRRKADHIRINLEEPVQSGLTTGLEDYRFVHNALPELDLAEVDTRTTFLDKQLQTPLLISSMTGGTGAASAINAALAEAAQARGIALALGSQRAAIENPSLAASFQLRKVAPDIPILANLGAVQLNYGYGVDQCRQAVEMAQADALILHLNPLQEALQPEGDTNFASLLPKIETICRSLSVPVIIKEVGWGISASVAKRLVGAGVWAIDVAGAGGTSWSQVEMHRAEDTARADLAAIFRAWGIPTSRAIREVRAALPETPVIASGGLADGLDLAKCIALGADLGGMAGIFLRAAAQSTETVIDRIDLIREQLRVTMFAIGCKNLHALSRAELRYEEPARNG